MATAVDPRVMTWLRFAAFSGCAISCLGPALSAVTSRVLTWKPVIQLWLVWNMLSLSSLEAIWLISHSGTQSLMMRTNLSSYMIQSSYTCLSPQLAQKPQLSLPSPDKVLRNCWLNSVYFSWKIPGSPTPVTGLHFLRMACISLLILVISLEEMSFLPTGYSTCPNVHPTPTAHFRPGLTMPFPLTSSDLNSVVSKSIVYPRLINMLPSLHSKLHCNFKPPLT